MYTETRRHGEDTWRFDAACASRPIGTARIDRYASATICLNAFAYRSMPDRARRCATPSNRRMRLASVALCLRVDTVPSVSSVRLVPAT
jgi:hypothetical protein